MYYLRGGVLEWGHHSHATVENLTIQASNLAKIGHHSTLNVNEQLIVESTGNSPSSDAIIRSHSNIEASSILVKASHSATIGEHTSIWAGVIEVMSTGNFPHSHASINHGAFVACNELTIMAPKQAKNRVNTPRSL